MSPLLLKEGACISSSHGRTISKW